MACTRCRRRLTLKRLGSPWCVSSQAAMTGDQANSTFQTRHLTISIDDVDTAQAWLERVFSSYSG